MSLFKDKKNKKELLIINILNERLAQARANHESCFYYPLTAAEVDTVKEYYARQNIVVESSHKTDNAIIYKFYGYLF